jgi:carbonic anhydrase
MKTTCLKPFAQGHRSTPATRYWRVWGLSCWLAMALAAGLSTPTRAADHPHTEEAPVKKPASPASVAKSVVDQIRQAVDSGAPAKKNQSLVIDNKDKKFITLPAKEASAPAQASHKAADKPHNAEPEAVKRHAAIGLNPQDSREYLRAKTAALTGHDAKAADGAHHGGDVHWSYEGENGPQAWGKLKSEFNTCAIGKRQSPINIEESNTLQGPAEPLQFNYQLSSGTVVNNGHTIQVDLFGDNSLTVRNSVYKLLQFHFHTPSEERVNQQGFAMVAHLVHRNIEGQLAVVSVLLDPGVANALINKVWTHMPLDANDRVRMPAGIIDMNELLPKDQRYYQFMGSLTTPPCTEGVLWMVLKQPTTLSPAQIKLFSQLFPNNARPVQPLNGRAVRDAQ